MTDKPALPYSKARLKKEFGDIYTKLVRFMPVAYTGGATKYQHPLVPFVAYWDTNAVTKAGDFYLFVFEGENWQYKIAVLGNPEGSYIVTHKGAEGDMEKMIEDLIAGKLAL